MALPYLKLFPVGREGVAFQADKPPLHGTVCRHYIELFFPSSGAGKNNEPSIRRPAWIFVFSRIAGELNYISSVYIDSIYVKKPVFAQH